MIERRNKLHDNIGIQNTGTRDRRTVYPLNPNNVKGSAHER
jgi:hypothetical protein